MTSNAIESRVSIETGRLGVAHPTLDDQAVPPSISVLFWDVGRRPFELRSHLSLLVRRVLNEGSWAACQWLRTELGDAVVRQQLQELGGRGVDRRALRLWQILLQLPESQVSAWLEAPERRIWDHRVG